MKETTVNNHQPAADVTRLLDEMSRGKTNAVNELLPLVYDELRRVAQHRMNRERANHTLSATALVHEVYMKLVRQDRASYTDRKHFFVVAADAMRKLLIDRSPARRQLMQNAETADVMNLPMETDIDYAALDAALVKWQQKRPDAAEVVRLRFYTGLSEQHVADLLGVSLRSVQRMLSTSKLWLKRELNGEPHYVDPA